MITTPDIVFFRKIFPGLPEIRSGKPDFYLHLWSRIRQNPNYALFNDK